MPAEISNGDRVLQVKQEFLDHRRVDTQVYAQVQPLVSPRNRWSRAAAQLFAPRWEALMMVDS